MVAPIRELANTSFFSTAKALLSNNQVQSSPGMDMDIDMIIPRGRSSSHSSNSSRESSVLSKASLVPYYERIEIQSNNPLRSEQVKWERLLHHQQVAWRQGPTETSRNPSTATRLGNNA